jgi:hypothetical protein
MREMTKAEETVEALRGEPTWLSVKRALDGKKTKVGGRLSVERVERDTRYLSFDPASRQRLDHFGNGGDGWDSDAWEDEYASPLRKEVEALLTSGGVLVGAGGVHVEIGEKGHVDVAW